ncbi:BON domain-containing protein [Collimonas sp. NPDC087041]|uniref:BON domain-containing protein n=1 Tax=Collimonas sp. NPDC087041 TaxID=3363960 RepID=UPI00381D0770
MATLPCRFSYPAAIIMCTLLAPLFGCNDAESINTLPQFAMNSVATPNSALTKKIKAALISHGDIDNFDIKINIQENQVVLSGFADSQAQVDRNLTVVRSVDGVTRVINHISVRKFT